jgi:hypothetical protein
VTGTVTDDGTNKILSFMPTASLALGAPYTATITTGAKDSFGNTLPSNFVWTFTTAATACVATPPPIVTSVAPSAGAIGICPNTVATIAGGNLGLSPGGAVTGFPPGTTVAPAVMHVTDPIGPQAQLDSTVAYNYAARLPNGAVLAGDMKGLTFTPGL